MPRGFGSESPVTEEQGANAILSSLTPSAIKEMATPKGSRAKAVAKDPSADPDEQDQGLFSKVMTVAQNILGNGDQVGPSDEATEDGPEGAIAPTGTSEDEGAVQASLKGPKQTAAPKGVGKSKRKKEEAAEAASDGEIEAPEPKKQKGPVKKRMAKAGTKQQTVKAAPRTKKAAKPTSEDEDEATGPSPEKVNGNEEWEVEEIVNSRRLHNRRPKLQYCVKWVGFEETTWEPANYLTHVKELVQKFHTANPKKPHPRK